MKFYYFDYNATTPLAPEVREVMEPFWASHFGNPASSHRLGQIAARAIRDARRVIADGLGAEHEEDIIFTSGGTESNNTAIRSALKFSPDRNEIITSKVEHSSVLKLCRQLGKENYVIHEVGVDANGVLNLDELRKFLGPKTALVTVMLANNETGAIFDLESVTDEIKKAGAIFHIDAVQATGKIPVDIKKLRPDFLSLSAHKFYGPKGIGALYASKKVHLTPLIFGGGQQRGRRAGTENVTGIVGMGRAFELVSQHLAEESERLSKLRDYFEEKVANRIPDVIVTSKKANRVPNTSHLRFNGLDAEVVLIRLDQNEICASSGSACMSGAHEPSHVLKAMGLSDEEAKSGLRFSFGRLTQKEDVDFLAAQLYDIVPRLRSLGKDAKNFQGAHS